MRITRPTRLLLWSSAAALFLTGVLAWKQRQDRVNPILHGQRLNYWVAELDRFPAETEPVPVSFGVILRLTTPLAADYLQEVPQLAAPRVLAFLQTRNSATGQFYNWCEQRLPKPVVALLPRFWVCQHPRRALEVLGWMRLGPDPALRTELEALWQGPEAGLHELAFRALFGNGHDLRRYYTNLLDAAPVIAAGLQHPSPRVHQLALKTLSELSLDHRLSEWPPALPPLIPLLEPLAQKPGDLAIRFEAEGLLRDMGVKRPAAVAISLPDVGSSASEPSHLFKTVDWPSLNSSASSSLVLPPAPYVLGDRVRVKDFGDSISGSTPLHLRE
jgi:hypothetical protein